MAIYTTNNTPYKGRSLQDMLVPYLMYTLRYDDIANKMGELGDLSVIWNNLLSPTRDHETWTMVNNYNERLGNTIADMLNGNIDLNTAMNRLQNMRREYNSWGTAVDNAYKQKQKFIEEQRALALQPGGYHVTRPAESISIDELMANPGASYEALSENELYTRGLNAAKAASDRKYSTYLITRFKGEYENLVNQQGYTQRDATLFLADKYNIPELGKIFDNISTEYNLNRFGNEQSIDRIQLDLAIFNGILDGMTGKRSELNLGRHQTPKPPTNPFDTNGSSKKNPELPIPLDPIVRGNNQGQSFNDNEAIMYNGQVVDNDVIKNQSKLNDVKKQLDNYRDAINKGMFTYTDFASDPSGNKKINKNASDFLNEDNTLKGGEGAINSYIWTYNGNKYSINEYNKLVNEYNKLKQPSLSIQDMLDKYSYLQFLPESENPASEADVVNVGRKLEKSVALTKNVDFPYKLKSNDSDEVVSYYNDLLVRNGEDNSNIGVFLVNDDNSLSKQKGANLVNWGKDVRLLFKLMDGNLEVGFTGADNNDYIWRGDTQIDNFTAKYNGVNHWLTDFTNKGVGTGQYLMSSYDSRLGEEDIYRNLNGVVGKPIPGTNFYGFVLYDRYTGDVMKLILDTPYYMPSYYYTDPDTGQLYTNTGSLIIGQNTMSALQEGNESYRRATLDRFIQHEGEFLSNFNKINQ